MNDPQPHRRAEPAACWIAGHALVEAPLSQIAADLGISESCLRNWLAQADIDEGRREGLTTDERAELAQLRREKRRLEMENEILKRAAAYFARENVLPK